MRGTHPPYSAMFSKGDNVRDFLFAYLEDKLQQIVSFIRRTQFMGGNNENDRVASPESVHIHLKVLYSATANVDISTFSPGRFMDPSQQEYGTEIYYI